MSERSENITIYKADIGLWFIWVLAALAGWLAASLLERSFDLPLLLTALVEGLALAVPQWLVLKGRLAGARLWAIGTFGAVALLTYLLGAFQAPIQSAYLALGGNRIVSFFLFATLLAGLQGLLVAVTQWVVLRAEAPKAGGWLWALPLAYMAATLFNLTETTIVFNAVESSGFGRLLGGLISLLATVISAGISGVFLVRILRRASQKQTITEAPA